MEEQIKTTLPELEEDKKEDDKDTVKYLMYIFIPLIIITLLCFRFNTLRLLILSLCGLFLCYTSYKTYKEKDQKFQKEILTQVIIITCTAISLYFKFFSDLVLSYISILLVYILLIFILKLENSKQKIHFSNFIFFSSIITSIILNYKDIILFFHKLFNFF